MITTGLESFIYNIEKYKKRSIALIANQTSITREYEYSWHVLKSYGLKLKRIFSPEHGIFGAEQDQIAVDVEPTMGCEIVSLYGHNYESLSPDSVYLDDIDLVLFDIQDVGARCYTYINTMALFMRAIENRDIEFLVLDRPNPLGGLKIEGPILQKEFESFVGILPMPVRHGMTAAELAKFYKNIKNLDINLSVEKIRDWERDMLYCQTGLSWIPPSPNMPCERVSYVYPGLCLLEGTNISEGRGTTTVFLNVGAPYIDPIKFSDYMNSLKLPGILFRPIYFKPTFNKYAEKIAGGVFLHITDIGRLLPFYTGVALIKGARDLYNNQFKFVDDVYEFNNTHLAFDLLTGGNRIREMIIEGKKLEEIQDFWKSDEIYFEEIRKDYLIY